MKKALLILLLIPALSIAQEKPEYRVMAGATLNVSYPQGISPGNQLGYYFGVSSSKKLGNMTGFAGSLTLLSQNSDVEGSSYSITSINGGFNFKVYPIKNLSINPGFQIGYIINANQTLDDANADIPDMSRGQMFATAGLSYELKRFEISATYMNSISNSPFNFNVAAGAAYRLNK